MYDATSPTPAEAALGAERLVRVPGAYPVQADTSLLQRAVRSNPRVRGARVLDVCTGTGAVAITAARAGAAAVTATDLSARSVLNARVNAWCNGLSMRVLRGDLLEPVAGEVFDLVLCNPPYVPAVDDVLPRHTIGRCWDGGRDGRAVLDRLCRQVPAVLAEQGSALITHSAVIGVDRTLETLAAAGLEPAVLDREEVAFGPVMRQRAVMLAERGLIEPGQTSEEVVVIEARR